MNKIVREAEIEMRDYRQEDWPANEENYFLLHYHTGLVVWFFVVCLFVSASGLQDISSPTRD